MKSIILIFNILFISSLSGQIADWENYTVPSDNYIKDAGSENGFSSDVIFVDNIYTDNPPNSYWSGWILSNGVDREQEGFINEHSTYAGSGADGSENFIVAYIFGEGIIKFKDYPSNRKFKGMQVSNTTFAYLSMLNGDNIAKRFGGEDGKDPDYFLLTVRGYKNGGLTNETVEFYLADYRFENNEEDYLVEDWTYIDLTPIADSDSLALVLSSSDVGAFGMNTPAYLCVDNIETNMATNSSEIRMDDYIELVQNLVTDQLTLTSFIEGQLTIFDSQGRVIKKEDLVLGENQFLMGAYPNGTYYLNVATELGIKIYPIVVQH